VAFRKFGGRFLVRGGASEAVEGHFPVAHRHRRVNDYATALTCYRSAEYWRHGDPQKRVDR
jgi:uncharacterized protein (DUF1330 family)